MMCDARLFAPQIEALSQTRAVQVGCLAGHDSIREMANAVLATAPPVFALAGLSLGAIVAMEVIRKAPDRVTRLALIATDPLSDTPDMAGAREPMMARARAGRLDDVLREFLPAACLAPGPGRAAIQDLFASMGRDAGADQFVAQSRALQRRPDQQGTLRRVRVPALVMGGAHDVMCPPRRHEFMAELIPDARLTILPEAGHMLTLEAPDAALAALDAWLLA
jgi:pimeloyl-ACP methyl ester carboxylesterase